MKRRLLTVSLCVGGLVFILLSSVLAHPAASAGQSGGSVQKAVHILPFKGSGAFGYQIRMLAHQNEPTGDCQDDEHDDVGPSHWPVDAAGRNE